MKISDEAVEAAEHAYEAFGAGMRDALEAAVPYLMPDPDHPLSSLDKTPRNSAQMLQQYAPQTVAALAGHLMSDREALEKLFTQHGVFETTFYVPEAVEARRRILAEAVADLFGGSEVPSDQPSPGNAGSEFICASSPDGRHNTVAALDGNNEPLGYNHCGYCGVKLDW